MLAWLVFVRMLLLTINKVLINNLFLSQSCFTVNRHLF